MDGGKTDDQNAQGQRSRLAFFPFGGVHEPLQHVILSSREMLPVLQNEEHTGLSAQSSPNFSIIRLRSSIIGRNRTFVRSIWMLTLLIKRFAILKSAVSYANM